MDKKYATTSYVKKIGSKTEVYKGIALHTSGKLYKKHLKVNKRGKVVSIKASLAASRNFGKGKKKGMTAMIGMTDAEQREHCRKFLATSPKTDKKEEKKEPVYEIKEKKIKKNQISQARVDELDREIKKMRQKALNMASATQSTEGSDRIIRKMQPLVLEMIKIKQALRIIARKEKKEREAKKQKAPEKKEREIKEREIKERPVTPPAIPPRRPAPRPAPPPKPMPRLTPKPTPKPMPQITKEVKQEAKQEVKEEVKQENISISKLLYSYLKKIYLYYSGDLKLDKKQLKQLKSNIKKEALKGDKKQQDKVIKLFNEMMKKGRSEKRTEKKTKKTGRSEKRAEKKTKKTGRTNKLGMIIYSIQMHFTREKRLSKEEYKNKIKQFKAEVKTFKDKKDRTDALRYLDDTIKQSIEKARKNRKK